jgi:predicted ATPase/class 3 adenylate cyclase
MPEWLGGWQVETLVLVLTDVQGSTKLWQDEPSSMDAAMRRHHEIVHAAVAASGGFRPVDQGEGDAVFAAFRSALDAVAAVIQVQRELAAENWPTSVPLQVRVGVHVGEVTQRAGNLYGDPVNRCARLRGLGSGGQTLLSAAVYELVRDKLPAAVTVRDLGQHRMKDLVRPEHVWQLDIDGLAAQFPVLASLDRVRHNLPVLAAPFIGREAELRGLVETLRSSRLVTLTGFGGMGKTRLALQAAAEVAEDFPGGVWFVDLSSVTDSALVPARVAEAAGVRFGADEPAQALKVALATEPTLLVLDNLEQVMGCAGFVAELVAEAPAVRVLCTSREPLRVRSERQVPLAPMALPTETVGATADSLSMYEAVQFFVDRACAVRPDFAISNETAPAVAAICARLDGHPLALELAAARVKMLSPDKLLIRLDSALGVLTGGSRDMPERHQTLRATIAWSFDSLSVPEQLLLARMSVLPAPADYDMLEAVCGQDLEVFDLLEVLVERSLVRTSEVEGDTRFGLLVSVRHFAAEHLDEETATVLRLRHARRALELFLMPRRAFGSVPLVARDLPHLRAALEHLRVGGHVAEEIALVVGVEDGMVHNGHLAEYVALAERVVGLTDDAYQLAQLHMNLVLARGFLGDQDGARRDGQLAVGHARRQSDAMTLANALALSFAGISSRAELDAALHEYTEIRERLSPVDRANIDDEIANGHSFLLRLCDPEAAEAVAREYSTKSNGAVHSIRLARILLDTGRVAEADSVCGHLADPVHFQGMRAWEIRGQCEVGRVALFQGRTDAARAHAEQAAVSAQSIGAVVHDLGHLLAHLERRTGDAQAGVRALDQVLTADAGRSANQGAMLAWRRSLLQHDLGLDGTADLEAARSLLEQRDLLVLELLGCLAVQALMVWPHDPATAARLLGCIDAHRLTWVLPMDLDDDVTHLLVSLTSSHPDELAAGRGLTPSTVALAPSA